MNTYYWLMNTQLKSVCRFQTDPLWMQGKTGFWSLSEPILGEVFLYASFGKMDGWRSVFQSFCQMQNDSTRGNL